LAETHILDQQRVFDGMFIPCRDGHWHLRLGNSARACIFSARRNRSRR